MATNVGMYSTTHESVTVASGQRWENTDRVKNQSDGVLLMNAPKLGWAQRGSIHNENFFITTL